MNRLRRLTRPGRLAGRAVRDGMLPLGLAFFALGELDGRPNVMVDGAPLDSTVLTLSHWPGSPTPSGLEHDLSAGIVFAWLRSGAQLPLPPGRRAHPIEPIVATTDHFDQDGLVGVYALTDPAAALASEDRLMAVAEAGDFARGQDRAALRACFALSALSESWPAGSANPALDGALHRAGLDRLPGLLAAPEQWKADWEEEDEFLDASEAALDAGSVTIDECADLDLAVVRAPAATWRPASQLGRRRPAAVHPVSVHNRSARSRVLVLSQPRYEMYFRYETWVSLASPRWSPRLDLNTAAAALSAAEPGSVRWSFNGIRATIARLMPNPGPSDLAPDVVEALVTAALGAGLET
ncbi:MAG TPA: DUF6687 family protein [Acidimicrobiales bacterium]|nr:DUF6687 family protein [Acidimicrobiales bacterium]